MAENGYAGHEAKQEPPGWGRLRVNGEASTDWNNPIREDDRVCVITVYFSGEVLTNY